MANIDVFNNNYTVTESLTKKEQSLLKKKMLGYGKVTEIANKTNLGRTTVYDAAAGKKLTAVNVAKLRAYLLN